MNYENWISYRYLTASKGRFLSFLNFVSVAGVAIGVMSLIIVTGIMTGFGNNIREKIIGTTPHIQVEKETGIADFERVRQELLKIPGVIGASAYVQGNIFLEEQGEALGQVVRGIDPKTEWQVTDINRYLLRGEIQALGQDGVVVGKELARYFGFSLGDEITLVAPGSGLGGRGWRYKFKIKGIFETGMIDYDMKLLLVDLRQAQEIFGLSADRSTGLGVRIKDPYKAKDIKQEIYKNLDYSYSVRSWIDMNRNLFEALFLEKWGLFIILTLMVLVASFNIVSTLIVTVMTKVHDIGILQSFGVTRGSIRRIFTKQGIFIGLKGIFWGVFLGVGISYILRTYVKVPAEIYTIDHVPVELQLFDLLAIISVAMIITFLASVYPAMKAAGMKPVEALRYE